MTLLNWPFDVIWILTSTLFSILEYMTFDLWTWYYLWLTLEVGATFVPTSDLRDTVVLEIHPIWPDFDNFTVMDILSKFGQYPPCPHVIIFWRRYILERNHVLTVILRSKVIMKVKVTGQMRIIPVVTWVKFNWNWLKYSGARVISRKCQKEKSYFWPLYLGQRSNRSQSHMTSPSYISGHLVQVWSKSAQPWLSNINKCDFPPAILFQIFQLKMKYT